MASKRDQIIAAVVDRLTEITVDNGYNTDVGAAGGVQLRKLPANRLGTLPTIVIAIASDRKDTGNTEDARCVLTLNMAAIPDHQAGTDIVTPLDDIVEDIERVLLAERTLSPPLDVTGCTDVRVLGWDAVMDESGDAAALLDIEVHYNHDPSDPSTWRGA